MKGRKPLPANLHILRGNPSKKPAADLRGGVNPSVEVPAPPSHLAGEALAEWQRITAELAQLGLVTAIDRATQHGETPGFPDSSGAKRHGY